MDEPPRRPAICSLDSLLWHFLDVHFDGTPGVAREFPLLVGSGNRARRHVIAERDSILSHAAWRPMELVSGTEHVRAAGIGLVTTHADYRRRGLAASVVEACVAQARDEGCEIALLFAPERSLYGDLGFTSAGRERLTLVDPGVLNVRAGKVRAGQASDLPLLEELFGRRPLRVARTREEFAILLDIPGIEIRILERADSACAVALLGKGRDLQGVVHEWGGEPDAVAELLCLEAACREEPLWVLSPLDAPAPAPGKSQTQAFAQIRVLRPDRFGTEDPALIFGDATRPARLPIYVWGLDSV